MAGFVTYVVKIEAAIAIDASSAPAALSVDPAGLADAIRAALRPVRNAVVATPTVTVTPGSSVEVPA